ncbi:MAG TPA: ribosome recycling factor [Legionellales bacterium]|jgi:ribosome recycling factor|nr:ribosome recycling factor [Legionellales bacterium]
MIAEIKQQVEKKMQKAVEVLANEMSKIRTGRANASLLDHVMVDYYGNETPLTQVANISAGDARTLLVTPWEKNMIPVIEKAILTSDLGLNPVTVGQVVRVPLPALNEERRKELTKVVRAEAELGRVAIRNVRRDANAQLKDLVKAKTISEDDERRGNDIIQKLTDQFIAAIDKELADKEKDLMTL